MDYEIVIPVLISFAISAILGPIVIPFLKRLKVGQTERKELESHLKKNGTPTMGGLMILASIIITSLFYVKDYPRIIPILFMTVGFGVIGFLDDYLKVVLRRSDGLLPWQKMILQFIVTTVFAVYMVRYSGIELTMLIPFPAKVLKYRMACDSITLFCSDRNRKRCEFYRWCGWPCVKCYHYGCDLFLRCGNRNECRDCTDHLCSSRSPAWILII